MSEAEESKKVKLTDEEIEKVAGGAFQRPGVTIDAGFYKAGGKTYYRIRNTISGISGSVEVYILHNDGFLYRECFLSLSLERLIGMERVAPENMPPIRF